MYKTTKNLYISFNHHLKHYKTTFLLIMLEVFRLRYFEDFEYPVVRMFTKKFLSLLNKIAEGGFRPPSI